ncbi:bifunctional phosphoribosyl-AMP cyclohydrolase/phosphoribosyl-ATP diphosphatase HisIE [Pontibacillus litoralis]|uniref:Histidine biosynthesis bifunctional protein HisIE n=1 Tax=Pontibacillus litoralis JSM 072002 TaxID=1385512 RepID=A0A0A5G547_9BACI|nr:bifunctional phosphoribosyl-AMP cyclohydrolase/phosphoribosyl-ATP diphosphatase HisIE [Pontibacillus litoralis]KGX86210.1 phosphoribosyl-ATP pyrophosphatase [Pontibacillus litoralis JSM 072002]
MNIGRIQFDENGLVPAIIQDARSKEVLTLAYMNEAAMKQTIESGETVLYSRSRQSLWRKGETSGHTQQVISMKYDCDRDAILLQVIPNGPACHKGEVTCFSSTLYGEEKSTPHSYNYILDELEWLLMERKKVPIEGSYTSNMLRQGLDRIAKKVPEEAGEVVIAAKNNDHEELAEETADLFFHTLLLLVDRGLSLSDVLQVLEIRHRKK